MEFRLRGARYAVKFLATFSQLLLLITIIAGPTHAVVRPTGRALATCVHTKSIEGVLKVDSEESFKKVEFQLSSEGPVEVVAQEFTHDGDKYFLYRRAPGSKPPRMGTWKDIRGLFQRLIWRYYGSHSIPERLLPDKFSGTLQYDYANLKHLLTSKEVADPELPRLQPLSALHEDSHYARREDLVTNESRVDFETAPAAHVDLQNVEIVTGGHYKIGWHGESEKLRKAFIGQRLELTRNYRFNGDHSIQVYEKTRFGTGTPEPVARTLVIKSESGTKRFRLDPRSPVSQQTVLESLKQEAVSGAIQTAEPVLKLRRTIKLVSNRSGASVEIGRLTIDSNLKLQNDSLPPGLDHYVMNPDFAEALAGRMKEAHINNRVLGVSNALTVEYDPRFENEAQKFIRNIRDTYGTALSP